MAVGDKKMIDDVSAPRSAHPALAIRGVSRSFGGIHAAKDVTIDVAAAETRVIIGPNGAGKSTLFNLITGELLVDAGSVTIFGEDVTHSPVQRRIKVGLGRTYQTSTLFMDLSVRENLFLSAWQVGANKHPVIDTLFGSWRALSEVQDRVIAAAEKVGIKDRLETKCGDLSHGEHRQIEIGITLAHEPRLLLLDEPLAGLSATERESMKMLVASLKKQLTLVIIEHDIDTAFALADTVTVMDRGSVVATGTPETIRNNPTVQEVYTLTTTDIG